MGSVIDYIECPNCKAMITEIEQLREKLCKLQDGYSVVCDRLWEISHKKR